MLPALENMALSIVSPKATNMIRLDHTHVLATFHRYKSDSPPRVKLGLSRTICAALEVHAQLEEEIFYPAIRAVTDNSVIQKSVPEHDEMRRLIGELRSLSPSSERYDGVVMELMRDVMHHVADEETVLLPEAERLLADDLDRLGAEMTKRRMQLVIPRGPEIAVNLIRAVPPGMFFVFGGAALAIYAAWRGSRRD